MATALLLLIHSVYVEIIDQYVAGLKKEALIANTEAQKELDRFQDLSKKANAGDAQAQFDLAMFYKAKSDNSSSKSNDIFLQKQEERLSKSVNQGNVNAQHELLSLYEKKNKHSTDAVLNQKIEVLLVKLAERGAPKDRLELGVYYANNDNIPAAVHSQ